MKSLIISTALLILTGIMAEKVSAAESNSIRKYYYAAEGVYDFSHTVWKLFDPFESWMTDSHYFAPSPFFETIEMEQMLDEWMTDPFRYREVVFYEQSETGISIEKWMVKPSLFL